MNNDWKVKAVVGEKIYNKALKEFGSLNDFVIEEMLIRCKRNFYLDKNKEHLLSNNSELWRSKFGELREIACVLAYTDYGIDVMEEADEKGVAKIRRE